MDCPSLNEQFVALHIVLVVANKITRYTSPKELESKEQHVS